jgi:hypothetical protein
MKTHPWSETRWFRNSRASHIESVAQLFIYYVAHWLIGHETVGQALGRCALLVNKRTGQAPGLPLQIVGLDSLDARPQLKRIR